MLVIKYGMLPFHLPHGCNAEPEAATGSRLLFCVAMESLTPYERLIIVAGVCKCVCALVCLCVCVVWVLL